VLPQESVESVVSNVRWINDDLVFDRYQYFLNGDRPVDEVKVTLIAKLTDDKNQLKVVVPEPDTKGPREFTFVRNIAEN
jgi:hypothetical protein